jgi:hypothetical protein
MHAIVAWLPGYTHKLYVASITGIGVRTDGYRTMIHWIWLIPALSVGCCVGLVAGAAFAIGRSRGPGIIRDREHEAELQELAKKT